MRHIPYAILAMATLLTIGGFMYTANLPSEDVSSAFRVIDYAFYQIEVEWPGSVCKFKECNRRDLGGFSGQSFNLHGVWPTGRSSNPCAYANACQDIPFENDLLTPEVQNLANTFWAGLYNPSVEFHAHEWEKHGVCWNDPANLASDNLDLATYMNDYFTFAINILQSYEPLALLANANIYPNDFQGYNYSDIQAALVPTLGSGFAGKCQLVDGIQYLHSVDYCLGLDYLPGDCPCAKAKKTNCKADLPVFIGEFVMPDN